MTDSRAAAGMDRLPWLADEPSPKLAPVRRGGREFIGWAAALVLLVAGASFWVGTRNEAPQTERQAPKSAPSSTTVVLPQPEVRVTPQPQVTPAPAPEVRPAPAREV